MKHKDTKGTYKGFKVYCPIEDCDCKYRMGQLCTLENPIPNCEAFSWMHDDVRSMDEWAEVNEDYEWED